MILRTWIWLFFILNSLHFAYAIDKADHPNLFAAIEEVESEQTSPQAIKSSENPESDRTAESEHSEITQSEGLENSSAQTEQQNLSKKTVSDRPSDTDSTPTGTNESNNKSWKDKNITETMAEAKKTEKGSASVLFREKPVFDIYYDTEKGHQIATEKAREASQALEQAMSAEEPLGANSKLVNVTLKDTSLEVRVRGYKIAELNSEEARAAKFDSLTAYQENLVTNLNAFVTQEFKRLQIKKVALQFFLAVFFAFMGFVVFHQARLFFNKADLIIEEKKESLKPMIFFSETLVSAHALGGLLALSLVIGRVVAYIVIILTTFAAILGQFAVTRSALSHLFSEILTHGLESLQSFFEMLPRFLLAIILLFFWNLSLNILDLFLKGVRSGRISWRFLQENRISVVRFWGTAISCILFFPLIVATLFGRFNTPIEFIAIGAAIVLIISTLPILVSIATGSFIVWQGNLRPGQWLRIDGAQGEITEIALHKITLVPEEGGRIHIPMSHLLLKSFTEMREYHRKEFRVKIKRRFPLKETEEKIGALFPEKFEIQVVCLSLSSTEYHFSIFTPSFQPEVRSEILSLLSQAHDQSVILLTDELIEEVTH